MRRTNFRHWSLPIVCTTVIGLTAAAQAPAATADEPPATTGDPTIESKYQVPIDLKTGRIDRTLPFDVPFLLVGTTDKADLVGIRAHAFEAAHAFRVEQEGKILRCVPQGPRRDKALRRAEWPRDFSLTTATAVSSDDRFLCGRWPYTGAWSRPPTTDGVAAAPFSLRIPPLDPNHYFVFVFELERKPDPASLAELKQEMVATVEAALLDRATAIDVTTIDRLGYDGVVEELRLLVRERLNRLAEPFVVGGRDEESSFFEPRGPYDLALRTAFRQAVDDVYNLRRQLILGDETRRELAALVAGDEPQVAGLSEKETDDLRELLAADPFVFGEVGDLAPLQEKMDQLAADTKAGNGVRVLAAQLADASGQILWLEKKHLDAVAVLVEKLEFAADGDLVFLEANSVGAFETRQTRHFNADIGFLTAPDLDQVFPYIGTNVYLRPVNKDAPLTGVELWKRCGFTVGATFFEKFGEGDDRVEPLFADSALVAGAGCRLNEYARLGGGVLVFREKNPDRLIDDDELSFSPYVSLSIDWDLYESFDWLRRLLSGLGSKPGG